MTEKLTAADEAHLFGLKPLTARKVQGLLKKQDPQAKLRIKLGHRTFSLGWTQDTPSGITPGDLVLGVDRELGPVASPVEGGVNEIENNFGFADKSRNPRRGALLWFTHEGNHYQAVAVRKYRDTVTIRTVKA